jgi:adenine-specific DNA-methyltransferase
VSNELNALLARVEASDRDTAKELRRHIVALKNRREFGLNFERHMPESVDLIGRPISVGDKVRFIPPRGETAVESDGTWLVTGISGPKAKRVAALLDPQTKDEASRPLDGLVYVADFRDPIYPGLKRSGEPVLQGGDKPFHTVINAENYHALEALLFAHQGKVDCIYIDPPYNTRDKDWRYNNDFVDPNDSYAHSQWLAFMERRLKVARKLLNPRDSVLIVTIDEKEYLRLGLLLEQMFQEAEIQMISSVISPGGVPREKEFTRVNEFIFFVMFGEAGPVKTSSDMLFTAYKSVEENRSPIWRGLLRGGSGPLRTDNPDKFFPVLVDPKTEQIVAAGASLPKGQPRSDYHAPDGLVPCWPLKKGGVEGRWELSRPTFDERLAAGYIRTGTYNKTTKQWSISYLRKAEIDRLASGELVSNGMTAKGHLDIDYVEGRTRSLYAKTVWNEPSHDAGTHGKAINKALIPERKFDYPKSVYAVEDTLRFFVKDKPEALVLDFFSGSGTTAHAVMRLNRQEGGRRRSISVTNNEVNDQEEVLRKKGLRPGDPNWEALGICDCITKPRIKAAVTGLTPDGEPVEGDYKFTDAFPMSDGFEENVEFFTLTYENPALVELDLAFERIAPLLWMRAGAEGRRIDERCDTFDVADAYGVLFNVDASREFLAALDKADGLRAAYIVTDDETQFQAVAGQLAQGVSAVRLYETYLRTFQINTGRH